jgi:hypothetical protein
MPALGALDDEAVSQKRATERSAPRGHAATRVAELPLS